MRFVTFSDPAAPEIPAAAGVLIDGDRVVDLAHRDCADRLGGTPPSVDAFVAQGLSAWARRLGESPWPDAAVRPLSGLRLHAPLRPGKVVGAAYNFTDALAERRLAHPAAPVLFVRSGSTVVGPGDAIEVPPDAGPVTYEAELAVVIGRRALNVAAADAMRHVAGYVAHNDVSGSGLIKADGGNFVRGKNLPATSPLGPWLVTPDEIADPHALRIRLDVDGRSLQDGSTATMLFRIAALIEAASRWVPLEPGDVIATGTPAGVAPMHEPPGWLQPGSTVTVEVERLGTLRNPVVAGPPFLDAGA